MNDSKSFDVVFNCSINVIGGGVQNAVNFIRHTIKNNGYGLAWFYILSAQVYEQLKNELSAGEYQLFEITPAKSPAARSALVNLVKKINPAVVYTSAGPTYVKFSVPHIMGCSNPYVLGASDYAYKLYGNKLMQFKRRALSFYQRQKIKLADEWIAQTEASSISLKKIVGRDKRIHIVHNAISEDFLNYFKNIDCNNLINDKNQKEISVLVPTAYYKHKDIEKIPLMISRLSQRYTKKFTVVFTIKEKEIYDEILNSAKKLGVDAYVKNIGGYHHNKALELYLAHDIILQPSVLEVFSTSYIEAMATLKPLVVPQFDFSTSICGDYAWFYDCHDMDSYVESMYRAFMDYDSLSRYERAEPILRKYGSQQERTLRIVNIIKAFMC
ncbi:glycosyltransferase [Enterobacter asburiae]|nr:glycosyltransferase [Enterobacter asburiae]